MKDKNPKTHNGQWNTRSTDGKMRWITKINHTTYWVEGSSATVRNGYSGETANIPDWYITYVDFDGGPTVKVGNTLHSYGVEGEDEFRVIQEVKMAAVPAKDLLSPDWVRVEVTTT